MEMVVSSTEFYFRDWKNQFFIVTHWLPAPELNTSGAI